MSFIIPIFIPHQGCPHACVFCNQFQISGQSDQDPVSPDDVHRIIDQWLQRSPGRASEEVQAAFYGGSFTGLPFARQEELLDAVAPFVRRGEVQTIRLSTRPDYIDEQRIRLLKEKGVRVVELGVQSLDDMVLAKSNRGHSAKQSIKAVKLLREAGFQVGIQMMIGLPLQTTRSLMKTVRLIASLRPDFVRIYPVLVLRGSRLARLYDEGQYKPLSLGGAVARAARIKKVFAEHDIRVIRIGLQAGADLERSLVAGPYHPAFGEMVASRIMFKQTRKLLANSGHKRVVVRINDKDQSVFRGVKSCYMKRLSALGLRERFTLQTDPDLPRNSVHIIHSSIS